MVHYCFALTVSDNTVFSFSRRRCAKLLSKTASCCCWLRQRLIVKTFKHIQNKQFQFLLPVITLGDVMSSTLSIILHDFQVEPFFFFLDCPKPDSPHRLLKCKKARVCSSDLNTAALRLPEVTPALFNYLVLFLLLLLFLKTVNCQQTVQRQCRRFIVTKRVVWHCSWINIYHWSKG